MKNRVITVQDIPITISNADIDDYICITDMAAAKSDSVRSADVIKNWLRNRNTLEFLGAWEYDLLNVALFGFTAKAWREVNPDLAGISNVRDYVAINELTVLSNLETHNAQMIREGKSKAERFMVLKEIVAYQMNILSEAGKIVEMYKIE